MWTKLFPFLAFLLVATTARAQQTPVNVSVCDLAARPKSFDGKTIRVRGTLNVYFEDFTLSVRDCVTQQSLWLAFGGDVPGIVASTVNDTFRKPGVDLKVNGISYGIAKDDNFHKLYALIAARHGDKPSYLVTATLTGAFLAGEERQLPNGKSDSGGYGHLGCCSLLVITHVSDVESLPPANLDVHGILLGPDGKPAVGITIFDDVLGGSPPERQQSVTNKNGEFQFSNSGQLLRFENPNYRPLALPIEPGGPLIRIKLEDAKRSNWLVPACAEGASAGRIGFSVLFQLPPTMKSSPLDNDDSHSLFIFPHGSSAPEAEFIISSGADQTDETVNSVNSTSSQQRWIKDFAGTIIGIDARGRFKSASYWRTATFFAHDSASYNLKRGKSAGLFDPVLDGACIAKALSPTTINKQAEKP